MLDNYYRDSNSYEEYEKHKLEEKEKEKKEEKNKKEESKENTQLAKEEKSTYNLKKVQAEVEHLNNSINSSINHIAESLMNLQVNKKSRSMGYASSAAPVRSTPRVTAVKSSDTGTQSTTSDIPRL